MAGELRLEWQYRGGGVWQATAGCLTCTVVDYEDDTRLHWLVLACKRDGTAATLLEAQLAAESAALAWLTEGVTALGGHVIDATTAVRLRAALRLFAHMPHTFAEERAACEELARKLGGG